MPPSLPSAPFTASYHPARGFLLRRAIYLLLAFDLWLVMIEHGGRYGAGNFNVAHFAWVDRLVGVPSPALYVGLLIFTGLLALGFALLRVGTLERLGLAVLYTASWVISLHDSYQHHYLLSWLLLWCAFIPEPALSELCARPAPDEAQQVGARPAVGLTLTAFTCAIVYAFTALSKSSPEWRSGAVLSRLSQPSSTRPDGGPLAALARASAELLSVPPPQILAWLSWSLIALQLVVALGYACSPGRDVSSGRVRNVLSSAGLCAAFSFHLGAEITGIFEIGWFSYYMLWIALVLLSPVSWVAALGRALATLCARLASATPVRGASRAHALTLGLVLACLFVSCGLRLDLPGAPAACTLGGLAFLVALYRAHRAGAADVLAQWALAGVVACVCLWGSITLTPVRFDFYRRWAGELSRLGELDTALALYRKAEAYAPPGASRAKQIEALERRLK